MGTAISGKHPFLEIYGYSQLQSSDRPCGASESAKQTAHCFVTVYNFFQRKSAEITWDILRNFGALNDESLDDTINNFDSPSNRVGIDLDGIRAFNLFYWSLEATEVSFLFSHVHLHRFDVDFPDPKQVYHHRTHALWSHWISFWKNCHIQGPQREARA